MKDCDNPIVMDFKIHSNSVQMAKNIAQTLRNEPWRANEYSLHINHAVRWAVRWAIDKPDTHELIATLLPHSDQAHDCRTLFKDACTHGRMDVLQLLQPHLNVGVVCHNKGHAIFLAAKNGNPDVLNFIASYLPTYSAPPFQVDDLFHSALRCPTVVLRNLNQLFPKYLSNVRHDFMGRKVCFSNVDNLAYLIDCVSVNLKHAVYHDVLRDKLQRSAEQAAGHGKEDCVNLLRDTHRAWFGEDLNIKTIMLYGLRGNNWTIVLNLAQESEDVEQILIGEQFRSTSESKPYITEILDSIRAKRQHAVISSHIEKDFKLSRTRKI